MSCPQQAKAAVETNHHYGAIPKPDLPEGVRLTKDLMCKHFPKEVFSYVDRLMKDMRTRRVTYKPGDHERGLYLDEGARYWVWDARRGVREVKMMSDFSGWISNNPVSRAVGETTPVGRDTWVVESYRFLGDAYIYVRYFP